MVRPSIVLAIALAAGCEDEVQVGQGLPGGAVAPIAPGSATPVDAGAATDAAVAAVAIHDEDFVESERNRDPFRGFESLFQIKPPEAPARAVKLGTTALDQMRIIAIITGVAQAKAMIIDPDGVGHTVERGDYVGRPDMVQAGGPDGMAVMLNWRVSRIYPNEVVLTREDPTSPNRPPLTRRLTMHEPSEPNGTK